MDENEFEFETADNQDEEIRRLANLHKNSRQQDADVVGPTDFSTNDIRDNNNAVYAMCASGSRVIPNVVQKIDEMSVRFIRTFA